jgi:hypothetical protein
MPGAVGPTVDEYRLDPTGRPEELPGVVPQEFLASVNGRQGRLSPLVGPSPMARSADGGHSGRRPTVEHP